MVKKLLSFIIAALIAVSAFAGCADETGGGDAADTGTAAAESLTDTTTEQSDTRFDGVNFNGREFRVYTSVNTNDATNANALIEGSGELNGDVVNDAVYYRNMRVEELLGIKFVFEQSNFDYGAVAANVRKLVQSGDDMYDLIINDLYPICELSAQGMFHNIINIKNFDYEKTYWYADYMNDLKVLDDRMFIMAGDYFTDVLASCHALFYNKSIINDFYGNGEYVYDLVLDGKWTMDAMIDMITTCYQDLNGDGSVNEGDQLGFVCNGTWGSMIPFVVSEDVKFIDRSSGTPQFAFNNERSIAILEKLNKLFFNEHTVTAPKDASGTGLRTLFAGGGTAFLGYQRLGDLANMRDIDFGLGIVPYPKFDEAQEKYITSTHDTTEIGVIPVTTNELDFISTVIEVCNRETASMVIPNYYETALKVKYTSDTRSAQMIDIVHNGISGSFALGYGTTALANFPLKTCFSDPLTAKSTDFASSYARAEKAALKALERLVKNLTENTTAGQ